jgi:hypothetical protein
VNVVWLSGGRSTDQAFLYAFAGTKNLMRGKMKILGKEYTGSLLQLPIPLEVKQSILPRLRTTGQKVSALYWLEFWREALDRAIVINTNNLKPVQDLKRIESEYSVMIEVLKAGLKRTSLKPV